MQYNLSLPLSLNYQMDIICYKFKDTWTAENCCKGFYEGALESKVVDTKKRQIFEMLT